MEVSRNNAQAAIEYLLIMGVVTAVVLVGFKTFLPKSRLLTEAFFNESVRGIQGDMAGNFIGSMNEYYYKARKDFYNYP